MNYDITDFSTKDSSEYNNSIALYKDALKQVDSDLLNFKEASVYRDKIPTRLRKKTHNSPDFLDENKARRKMNADTSAIAELTDKYSNRLSETLMFGSNKEDLENELIKGGLGKDILKVFKKHNITGKAIWDSLASLKSYIGADPDILTSLQSLQSDSSEDVEDENYDEDEEEDSSDESEELEEEEDLEASNSDTDILSERFRNIQKRLAERNLRKLLF